LFGLYNFLKRQPIVTMIIWYRNYNMIINASHERMLQQQQQQQQQQQLTIKDEHRSTKPLICICLSDAPR